MPHLKKALSRWDSVAIITAIVIGVGIFRVPAEVAKYLQSPILMLIAWFLGGINAVWASILILLGTFAKLLFFTGVLVWLFFALAVVGIFILRRKFPAIERPYKVWGYPATPAIFIMVCAVLFVNTIVFNPVPSFAGLCLLASGMPVYFVSKLLEKKI